MFCSEYLSRAAGSTAEFLQNLGEQLSAIVSNTKLLLEQGVVIDLSKLNLASLDLGNIVGVVNRVLNETTIGKLAEG